MVFQRKIPSSMAVQHTDHARKIYISPVSIFHPWESYLLAFIPNKMVLYVVIGQSSKVKKTLSEKGSKVKKTSA